MNIQLSLILKNMLLPALRNVEQLYKIRYACDFEQTKEKITIFEGALPAISSVSRVKRAFSRSRHDRKRAIFLNLTLIEDV